MSEGLAVRMADLPSIGTAALPANYQAATEALARCHRIDECKDWADKMAALASYAKQADDPTLHNFAVRISARAIRRCGELLQTFQSPGGRPLKTQDGTVPSSQTKAGEDAGMSERQIKTAVRVANVPAEDFEAAVECEHPATVTQLAAMGKTSRPAAPEKFPEATHILGVLHELALFCVEHEAAVVGRAVFPYEVRSLQADAAVVEMWVRTLLNHLPEATACS
jgi:hypothetical protein